jgi:hypothetical protein
MRVGLTGDKRSERPVVEDEDAEILKDIHRPDVALAIWKRTRPSELADWLDSLPAEHLPVGRFVSNLGEARSQLTLLCDLVKLHDSRRELLIDDVTDLVHRFADVTGKDRLDVRLEAVDHDSCWRFHRDYVGFRLNATYRGPGTQWPPIDQARRAARAQRRYGGPLNEIAAFTVGLFKGTKLAGDQALLHRSPPIAGRGVTRLFLCLNEEAAE